jgi:hypothetical protein
MIMKGHIPVRLPRLGIACVVALGAIALPAWAQRPFDSASGLAQGRQTATTVTSRPEAAVEVTPEPLQGRTVVVSRPTVATTIQSRTTPQARVTLRNAQLPEDAQKLVEKYSEQEAQVRKEAEAKLEGQRATLIKDLQALQDSYTKAGKLDEAVAIRDRIRQLQSVRQDSMSSSLTPSAWVATTEPARGYSWAVRPSTTGMPMTLTRGGRDFRYRLATATAGADTVEALRGHVGETFTIPVVGSVAGTVWGTGTYTDDSSVSTAAVHAGLVENGKLGFVRVTILQGRDKYDGSTSHGVTSESWANHGGSFKLERDSSSSPVLQMTTPDGMHLWSLPMLRGPSNVSLLVDVVGTNDAVWGTDIYTDDSSIGAAAVHAGILKVGEKGVVKVTLLGAKDSFQGSARNGITSESFGPWPGSFKIERK